MPSLYGENVPLCSEIVPVKSRGTLRITGNGGMHMPRWHVAVWREMCEALRVRMYDRDGSYYQVCFTKILKKTMDQNEIKSFMNAY